MRRMLRVIWANGATVGKARKSKLVATGWENGYYRSRRFKQNKLVWQGVVEGIIPEKEKKVVKGIDKVIAYCKEYEAKRDDPPPPFWEDDL